MNTNKYITKIKEEKLFNFIDEKDLRLIIENFFAYVFYISDDLENCEYDKFLTEFKTHTIIIYMGSIIEAIVYYFAKEKLSNKEKYRRKYLQIEEFKKHQDIKGTDLYICKLEKKEISLNDSINFKALIDGLKDNNLLNKDIIEKINDFRKARNSIHINVFKTGEEIFENLIKVFNNFRDIRLFIKTELNK